LNLLCPRHFFEFKVFPNFQKSHGQFGECGVFCDWDEGDLVMNGADFGGYRMGLILTLNHPIGLAI
jgi:hypothetical protein